MSKELLYEDSEVVAFKDIMPKAPIHIQVISREHIPSVAHLQPKQQALVGKMVMVAKGLAEQFGIAEKGYKLVFNVGKDGGQVIPHLHMHLLGGRSMDE